VKPRVPLGKLLLDEGYIDELQFKSIVGHQRRYGGKFASLVYGLGFVSERVLLVFLARQLGFPAVALRRSVLKVSNADVLPREVAERYQALPAVVERDKVLFVLADPNDMKTLDELRFICGRRVLPHVGLEALVQETIQRLYDARAAGTAALVYGEDADPYVSEHGHVEIVTAATPLDPPARRPGGVAVAAPGEAQASAAVFDETVLEETGTAPALETQEPFGAATVPTLAAVSAAPTLPAIPAASPPTVQPPSAAAAALAASPPGRRGSQPLQVAIPAVGASAPSSTAATVPAMPAAAAHPGSPPLVLIVDSDTEVLNHVRSALRDRGYRIVSAADGLTALDLIRNQAPDAVVLEASLPGVHGFEICQKIRASRRFARTPVVLLTARYRGDGYRRDIQRLFGVDLVLEKPFHVELLARRVEELLARSGRIEARESEAQQRSHEVYVQGGQLLGEGKVDEAIDLLRRAAVEDPFSEHLHFQLGTAYRRKQMDAAALEELEWAVELKPDFYPALQSLAVLYQERGFRRKSFELWERALEYCPDEEMRKKIREHLVSYFTAPPAPQR
jgi:DNA-binding response OmpR family regulator